MNKSLIAAPVLLIAISAGARNLSVDVDKSHNLWWNAPETPVLNLNLTDTLGAPVPSRLRVVVTPDTLAAKTVVERAYDVMAPASLAVDVPVGAPGFYRVQLLDDGNVISSFNIGYEPTNVVSLPDSRPDFEAFWKQAKAELAEVPADVTLTLVPEKCGRTRDVYNCTYRSWGGDTIDAVVIMPKEPGTYPVQVYYNGYGGQPWPFDADGRPGWIEMLTSVRGQFYSQPRNTYGDWIQYHIDDPATYYYKGAYLDAVRAIDVLENLPGVDRERMYAEGGSQGGALTLVAAALADGRLRAIAPYIPFMSDFPHYFRIVDWPAGPVKAAAREAGLSDEQMYANLSYFDIKNHARNITCPVLMGIGLQDPTCPPHTNMSSYNLISSPKELRIYPECGHTVDYGDWNPRRDRFFEAH
ncbi:MAG: acetylxylan esterase [Muribaculaceae bacterium]|nr:acetylxylan esterase [Muribaculaceae bacterium]